MVESSGAGLSGPSKQALRSEVRARRRGMPQTERDKATASLTEWLKNLTRDAAAKRIGCYLSTVDEPSTEDYLQWAHGEGLDILLPISREDGLMDWALYDGGDHDRDWLGMPVPTSQIKGPMEVDGVDLLLVPAASVDRTGGRLGWGRGYFDRLLGSMEKRPPVYAVVFDHEVVDSLPREPHDQGVDGAVTPSGILRFIP